MLAALRAWAAVRHVSEADRISAAEQRDRGLAADQQECDLLRGQVSVLSSSVVSVRSQRTAQTATPWSVEMQTGTPWSVEIAKQQASAETRA
jgi:hypothetical protein